MKWIILFALFIAVAVAIPIQSTEDGNYTKTVLQLTTPQTDEEIYVLLFDDESNIEADSDDSDNLVIQFGFGKKLKKIGKKIKHGLKEVGKVVKKVGDVTTVVEVGKGILGVAAPKHKELSENEDYSESVEELIS